MKRLSFQEGYVLTIVLLSITIFSIFFLTFMGHSMNNVKQIEKVETESQAVALAEMGISYYQTAVKDIFLSKKDDINAQVVQKMETDIQVKSNEDYLKLAVSLMKTAIQTDLNLEQKKVEMAENDKAYFTIENFHFGPELNKITVYFDSVGSEEKNNIESTTLRAVMEITLDPVDPSAGSGSGGGISISVELPKFDIVKKPEKECYPLSSCSEILVNYKLGDLNKALEILLGGLFGKINTLLNDLTNNNTDLSGKTIYSTTNLNLGGNLNDNISDLKLHSKGDMILGGNVNNNNKSKNFTIESEGGLKVEGHLTATGESTDKLARIFVNGDFVVVNKLYLTNYSSVYVGNTSKFDELSIGANCKVCVHGDLELGKGEKLDIGAGSTLIVGGNIINGEGIDAETMAKIKTNVVNSSDTDPNRLFTQYCGNSSTITLPYKWGEKIINNVEYNY